MVLSCHISSRNRTFKRHTSDTLLINLSYDNFYDINITLICEIYQGFGGETSYTKSVAGPFENFEVTVFGEYFPKDQLTVASFIWPIPNTSDTYTIAINPGLSLEFDKHLPVRLSHIALYDNAPDESDDVLDQLTDRELSKTMAAGRALGTFIISLNVSRSSRLLIASMQLRSPSTPPPLRRAVAGMLQANHVTPAEHRQFFVKPIRSVTTFDDGVADLPPAA